MRRVLILTAVVILAGCSAGYTNADAVYSEPAEYVYVVPMDRVVLVTRDVLVQNGFVVYRVQRSGPNRIIWARHGNDDVVRIFATPRGDRVTLRGIHELRDHDGHDRHGNRGRHEGWVRQGAPREILAAIDIRLRNH